MTKRSRMDEGFKKAGLPGAQRHAFLCIGPDCCGAAEGKAAWDALKRGIKEFDLPVMRTKAGCFRVCRGGPWLVVYPEGVWYGEVTAERMERIVTEHLDGGRPVKEWIARVHPLVPGPADG
jgi:(2Fe-2S) ferredoxin